MKTGPKSNLTKQGDGATRLPVSVSGIITLLTDFGASDYYTGAIKGVILSANPSANIVDITHEIPPQDIETAAFVLLSCYRDFPPGTIHVAVVDPGVGSARRPILISAGSWFFIGPDNGLFSYVLDREDEFAAFHLTESRYFRQPLSTTFHGRDIFTPVAAELSKGTRPDSFGPRIHDPVRLPSLRPVIAKNGNFKARIIHIDTFGNCVTNLERTLLNGAEVEQISVKQQKIRTVAESYTEKKSGLLGIWGSAGFLELSVRNGSAAKVLKARRGDVVKVSTFPIADF
ncbi:MAG TPA: SAM-dependent chlorinase/fluorinase [Pyrinomonadaceae bacterium]